jgi:SP family sugar:H+ symporter-like MFS transporter
MPCILLTGHRYQLETYYLSLLGSLTYIGFALGLVTGNILSARIGRKKCFMIMCFYAILGTIVCITSTTNKWQMIAGRIIAYVYIGMELALVPVTQTELVPASVRGATVGTYQSALLLGQLLGAVICRGTAEMADDRSWRVPLGLLFVIPTFMLCAVWYIPESPRWLLQKGRNDEALNNLRLLRQGKFTEEQIMQEYIECQSTLSATVDKGNFMEMFQSSKNFTLQSPDSINSVLMFTSEFEANSNCHRR